MFFPLTTIIANLINVKTKIAFDKSNGNDYETNAQLEINQEFS